MPEDRPATDDATLLETRPVRGAGRSSSARTAWSNGCSSCLLAGGHCCSRAPPGVAKTLAAETLATVVGGTFARVQFTPDLLPADIIGTRIYRASTETFDVELGPVFVNLLLADEINRAPAKVQSALLEVMAERQVSIGGHHLPGARPVPGGRHPEPDRVARACTRCPRPSATASS